MNKMTSPILIVLGWDFCVFNTIYADKTNVVLVNKMLKIHLIIKKDHKICKQFVK